MSSSTPLNDAHKEVSVKDEDTSPPANTTKSEHLTDMHDFESSYDVKDSFSGDDVKDSSSGDELESTCSIEKTDLSVLDKLRELAAARLLAAAQNNELESALQVVRAPPVQEPLVATPGTLSSTHGNAAELQQTETEMPLSGEDTADDNCCMLQTLRCRAVVGIVAAARAGNLGSILNSSSGNPAPPRRPVPPKCVPMSAGDCASGKSVA